MGHDIIATAQTTGGNWLAWLNGYPVTPLASGRTAQEAKENFMAFVRDNPTWSKTVDSEVMS